MLFHPFHLMLSNIQELKKNKIKMQMYNNYIDQETKKKCLRQSTQQYI